MKPTIKYPLLLDGGLSNQLESQGSNLHPTLWTAELLKSDPEAIVNAHLAYLEAGAKCIITASYQATIPGFQTIGINEEEAKMLISKSVSIADKSIDRFIDKHPNRQRPFIAASIGPYGAYLADGSEYKGNYGISEGALRDFHLPRIQLLDASKADFLAFETIPSYQEAKVYAEILRDVQKPAWITFSCKDARHIHDGTPIEKCIGLFRYHPSVFAVGVNCTAPKYISDLIIKIKSESGDKKIIVYPNSGEKYHKGSQSWTAASEPVFNVQMVKEWMNQGVHIIGGCCRVGPEQIREVAELMSLRSQQSPKGI